MKLNFEIETARNLIDGSRELYLVVKPEQEVLIGYMLEVLEGFCYHTIVDFRGKKFMKLTVVADFQERLDSFLSSVKA